MPEKTCLTTQLSNKTEFFAVDFFRLIFSISIVVLHLRPFADIDSTLNFYVTQVFTRVGVPFFFLVSGFFLQKKLNDFEKTKNYLIKLLRLYLIYTLIYLPQIISSRYLNREGSFLLKTARFVKDFIFVGSYVHLWYFAGLIAAALLLYLFINKLKLSDKKIAIVVVVLYVIGTFMNAYIQPLQRSLHVPISEFASIDKKYLGLALYFEFFSTTRNGLFFGLPCLFFGYLIAKNQEKIYRKNYFILSLVSLIVMTAEVFVVYEKFGGDAQDMVFTLLPASIFVFLFVLFIDCKNSPQHAHTAKRARDMSVLFFGLHLFIDFYVNDISSKLFNIQLHSMIRFFAVIILTYIAAKVIIRLSDAKHFKWLKNLY